MKTITLPISPGETVQYSDIQFHLPNAILKCIKIHSFGIYAELEQDGEEFTVKYERLQRPKATDSTETA